VQVRVGSAGIWKCDPLYTKQVLPFFDFPIDLEEQGGLLRLRLTREDRIKPFILAELPHRSK
jgi:hypothetical protein